MQAQLDAHPASAHLFAHVTGSIQMLVNSFNVIDQTVLAYTCLLAHKLFSESDAAQLLFCREGGLAALYECLHDYDITVRTLVLKLLTVLASNYELPTRQDMVSVESGALLPRLIGLLQDYGQPDTDDVDLAVAEAACGLLSHLVLYEPVSSDISGQITAAAASVMEIGAGELEQLAATRGHDAPMSARRRGSMSSRGSPRDGENERQVLTNMLIVGGSQLGESRLQCPQPPVSLLLQKLCSVLSTVAYQDASCQTQLLQSGTLELVFELLASPGLRVSCSDDLAALMSALTLLVNAVDKNVTVQDSLCDPTKARTIVQLLQSGSSGLQGLAALLIGHLCLNHHANKMLYGSRPNLELLLNLLGSVAEHGDVNDRRQSADGIHAAVTHDDDGLPSGFDSVQYDAGRTGVGSSGGAVPPEQMALGALMALINLSHQNVAVNSALAELAVVEVVMEHLASRQNEVRKAATLFLAGLVAADKSHARAIAEYIHPAGAVDGVELLLCNLSDDDDADDLSQHSFLVLSNMESVAADRMVTSTERYLGALPSAEPLGGHAARLGGSSSQEDLVGHASAEPECNELLEVLGHSELCTRLDKYFAVLNGLVYSKPAVRKFISNTHGIAWVLKVLLRDVTPLPELVAHACYLLSNLVAVEPKLQERAREQRAFEIISRYLQRVDRTTDQVDSRIGGEEAMMATVAGNGESVTILYTTLQKLAFNHAVNLRSAGADVGLLRCLQADCRAAGASPELRDSAAELLLQLSTPNAATATASGSLVRLVMELQDGAVSCATSPAKLPVSDVVAAKASQWLRDGGHS